MKIQFRKIAVKKPLFFCNEFLFTRENEYKEPICRVAILSLFGFAVTMKWGYK